jgi:hypothetical protein
MTTTTDVAVREDASPALHLPALPNLPDTDSWIRAMASIAKLADQICNTSFVPKGLRGDPASVTAAILTGRELDMGPMQSLRHIHVVEGTPSLDAEYKRAKVLSLGHEFRILEWDDDRCKVAARRKGDPSAPLIAEYTIRDARRAGLVKDRGNYITRPKVMMLARVTTLVCNAIFADVTNGLATTELLEAGDEDAVADAIGASVEMPQRRVPETADLRQRARAQTVTATVVTPEPSPAGPEISPHSGDAAARPQADVPPAGEAPDPAWQRALKAAQAQCKKVLGDDSEARHAYAARILRVSEVRSFNDLKVEELREVATVMNSVGSRDELEALLTAGEVRGEVPSA